MGERGVPPDESLDQEDEWGAWENQLLALALPRVHHPQHVWITPLRQEAPQEGSLGDECAALLGLLTNIFRDKTRRPSWFGFVSNQTLQDYATYDPSNGFGFPREEDWCNVAGSIAGRAWSKPKENGLEDTTPISFLVLDETDPPP